MIDLNRVSGIAPMRIRVFGAALAGVVIVSSGIFAVGSFLDRRERVALESERYQAAADELDRLGATRRALQDAAGTYSDLPVDDEVVIVPETVNALAAELTRLADQSVMRTTSIREVPDGSVSSGPRSIVGEFSGDYQAVQRFMDSVHEMIPSVHVERVRLAAESENDQALAVSVTLAWYAGAPDE